MKARSSAAERCHHMAEVGGSIPSAPIPVCLPRARWASRFGWLRAVFLATGVLAGCAPTAPVPHTSEGGAGEYVLGAGDRVTVFVYESPQLGAQDLPVRPDGRLSLPLVPDIQAAGRTPTELGRDIAGRLSKYVKEPNVSVMVREFVGPFDRQIRVIGEATEPQAIAFRDGITLLDVMIITKGLTKFAAGNNAVLVRGRGADRTTIRVRLSDLLKDGDIDQNLSMRPGDTLIIPQTWF